MNGLTKISKTMTNICSVHEREALRLLDEFADNEKETVVGTMKWIEPNDEAFRLSWGRVLKVKLDWFADGTGWFCSVTVKSDTDCVIYRDLLMRDESDEDQQRLVDLICDWVAIPF